MATTTIWERSRDLNEPPFDHVRQPRQRAVLVWGVDIDRDIFVAGRYVFIDANDRHNGPDHDRRLSFGEHRIVGGVPHDTANDSATRATLRCWHNGFQRPPAAHAATA